MVILYKKWESLFLKILLIKINGLTLRGNSLKFVPNISTSVYYKGIDTIDEVGKMIDSNLIIEYVDATKE